VTLRVEITRVAASEVGRRYDDMAVRSVRAARRWRDGLLAAVEALAESPERCPQAPEVEWYGDGLRELYYGKRRNTYRILFVVRGGVVYILRVRHGRQDFLGPDDLVPPPPGPS
jgi:plasmid stabilization system protein ParE